MLDRKFVVENVDAVAQNCVDRGVEIDVASLVEQETARRELQQRVQELNRLANEVSKSIGQAKDPAERESRKAEGRNCSGSTIVVTPRYWRFRKGFPI